MSAGAMPRSWSRAMRACARSDEAHDVGRPLVGQVLAAGAGELGGEQQDARVAVDLAHDPRERAAQLAARLALAVEVGRGGEVHRAERLLDEAVDDRALVGEVEVDRRAADVRAPRDGVHGQRLEADVGQRLARGGEDRLLGRVARLHRPARGRRGGRHRAGLEREGHALARLGRRDHLVDEARARRLRGPAGARPRRRRPARAASAPAAISRRCTSSTACRGPMTPIRASGQASVRSAPRSREFMTMCAPP